MDFTTHCIHGNNEKYDKTGAVSVPIFQTATFSHPGVGQSTGYDYSRLQNPTRQHLEKTVAKLENGTDAMAFSTGMAAIVNSSKQWHNRLPPQCHQFQLLSQLQGLALIQS